MEEEKTERQREKKIGKRKKMESRGKKRGDTADHHMRLNDEMQRGNIEKDSCRALGRRKHRRQKKDDF